MALSPGGSLTAINAFVAENGQMGKYPTNQREWNSFIQQLARMFVEYEGTYNATGGGFSTPPTFTVTYYRYGKFVMLGFTTQEATSNAAAFSLTAMPTRIRPAVQQRVALAGLIDNGSPVSMGEARIATNGVISISIDGASGGFTTSGQKGFGDNDGASCIFSLFDAKRID